jgi:hypothetical protein
MVLTYLGIEKTEAWLWRRLRSGDITPFSHVKKLAAELSLVVEVADWGSLATFGPYLEAGLPMIVAVDADLPSEWPYYRDHAVVVVGFDDDRVYVHDPAQAEAPLAIDMDTFMLAWTERDYEYAVIRLAED